MLIGITGGIGSGKSYVVNQLRQKGYAVYDTDKEAKRLINDDEYLRGAIVQLLGESAYSGGVYQCSYVAKRVFTEAGLLKQLNKIVHPVVAHDLQCWALDKPICFAESAILFESGLNKLCDKIALVVADEKTRIQRVIYRDGVTREMVEARMRKQLPVTQLFNQVDWVVENGAYKICRHGIMVTDFINLRF